jgi:hypothetical protein
MSIAAKEMTNPPAWIRWAKIGLLVQLGTAITYAVASVNNEKAMAAVLLLSTWGLHFLVCFSIARAAAQMQRRWWRYTFLPIVAPFFGPLGAIHYLEHWRDTRP